MKTQLMEKEQWLQKKRLQIWDFQMENLGKRQPTRIEEDNAYMMLHHNVAAAFYVANQNIKSYRVLYPLCVLIQLGIMTALCAMATSVSVKVASMIVFPLSVASIAQRKNVAIQQAKQAKIEGDSLLSRFDKFEQMPVLNNSFQKEYPALVAQSKTIRGSILKSRPAYWRYVVDLGNDLWQEERQRG